MKRWDFRSRLRRYRPEWQLIRSSAKIDEADFIFIAVIGTGLLIVLLLSARWL